MPLPLWIRIAKKARHIAFAPLDAYDLVVGNRPPDELIFTGDGSWRGAGREFLHFFKTLGHLKPDHHVLDVGSGIGRMAVPLTRFLNARGSYTGFDVVKNGIDWCQMNISHEHPNFAFIHADVANKHYNPSGQRRASDFVFPFPSESFDFVFLTSVFTHMLPSDFEHYVVEIARVMKPRARCLMTFFLINTESLSNMASNRSALPFSRVSSEYYTTTPSDPEYAVGLDENHVTKVLASQGIQVIDPINYGYWCGRRTYTSFQDIVVGMKREHLR